jgi:hypothetical protein
MYKMNEAHFEVYPQQRMVPGPGEDWEPPHPTGQYGWRFRAANGQITAVGGEGFTTKADAERAIRNFCATVVDVAVDTAKGGVWAKSPLIWFEPVIMDPD